MTIQESLLRPRKFFLTLTPALSLTSHWVAAKGRAVASAFQSVGLWLRLRRAGIVDSTRGARGGYVLARPASDITVKDVVAASELQTFDMHCTSSPLDEHRCADSTSCSIRPVWALLQAKIDEVLNGIRLADLLANEQTVRVRVKLDAPPELARRMLPVLSAG